MFCPQCGSKQPDDAQFCPQCGATLGMTGDADEPQATPEPAASAEPEASAAPAPATPTSVAETVVMPATSPEPEVTGIEPAESGPAEGAAADASATSAPDPSPEKPERKSHRTVIIAGAIAAALVCGGGAGGVIWWQGEQARIAEEARIAAEEQAAYEAAHQKYPIQLIIQCDGLDTATGTMIPLHVTGTDFEGNEVDELFFTDQNSTGVELMQGDYVFEVPASPIAADGTIYDVAAPTASGLGGAVHEDGTFETQNVLMLEPIDAADVTDDQIEAAYDMAVQGGCENADELRDAAIARRDEAVEQLESGSFDAASYSFSIPEQWVGRVSVAIDGDTVTIAPNDQPNHELCTLEVIEGGRRSAGDISKATVEVCDLGDGRTVIASVPNYCYLIPYALDTNSTDPDDFYTQSEADELVDLQTLGASTYDDALAAWNNNPGVGLTNPSNPLFQHFTQSVSVR